MRCKGKFKCVLCVPPPQVIIGAPTVIGEDLLRTFNISLVVRGSVTETRAHGNGESARCVWQRERGGWVGPAAALLQPGLFGSPYLIGLTAVCAFKERPGLTFGLIC